MEDGLTLPISPETQDEVDKLLLAFAAKTADENQDGYALKQLVMDIGWLIHKDRGGRVRQEADQITSRILLEADLHPDLGYYEGILNRLGENPLRAYKYIADKKSAQSKRNQAAAIKPRTKRDDWWAGQVDDCLDDTPQAKPAVVEDYLLETTLVVFNGGQFHYIGPDMGNGYRPDPISKAALRGRIRTAKRRKAREG